MGRIIHTGDIGRAKLPSTVELLQDHSIDCLLKADRLFDEARRLYKEYGDIPASTKTYEEAMHWWDEGMKANGAILAIREMNIGNGWEFQATVGGARGKASD